VNRVTSISDLDVHAYIDGEMDAAQARAFEDAASRDSALAERIAAYRSDKALLNRAYSPLAERPLPPEWETLIRNHTPAAQPRTSWRMVGSIAAMILVVVGGGSFYLNQSQRPGGDVVQTALEVRDQGTAARTSIAVSSLDEARRYDGTLRRIVNAGIKVPDLERMGYRVTKLDFYDRAAEVQYRDQKNALFTLYIRTSDGKTRFDQFEQRGLRICVWQDDRISTVMAGTMSAAQMQRLASLAYLGLSA
jgi:anti-sigma factor RsiW